MKVTNLYTPFSEAFENLSKKDIKTVLRSDPQFKELQRMASYWGEDYSNVERWMASPEYKVHKSVAEHFIQKAPHVIEKVQSAFGEKLKGELRLSPSFMGFDGFARYELGNHTVWFGVDHPDADEEYLSVLLSHELSHVYRDHQPRVWAHLGKPLEKVTRQEYLDAHEAEEHLASEGLATLYSQSVFPNVPMHVHHYYHLDEMKWCMENFELIDKAIRERLQKDKNVWAFYEENVVAPGSPSRTQYFWAARVLAEWLPKETGKSLFDAVREAHGWPWHDFSCFK
jgi:hypothetical protein